MGLADDILALPTGLKLLVGFVLVLGASIKFIPFIDLDLTSETFGELIFIGVGQIIFTPITFAIGFLGISFTWELFVVFYGLILVLIFVIWIIKVIPLKR